MISRRKRELRWWSSNEDYILLELWNEGYTAEEIADVIHRTPSAIYNRLHILRQAGECGATYAYNVDKCDPRKELNC